MQQLISSAREHDERVHEAVMKASKEFEKKNKKLEEKYVETSRMVANLTFVNSQLTTALQVKEKLTDDANEQMSWTTGEFDILMARLDSKETENAFLKSEFKKLEKELEIRNEEMEFNCRSSDALEKKHLENVRKINKLEAECRKLRAMVQKQIPGSPEPARTNSIVEMQGKIPNEVPDRRISFMSQRVCEVEAENKNLKEIADSKDEELRALRTALASLSSKLLQVEDQFENHSESQKSMELIDGFASWASTLLSQLENFKHRERENASECRMIGVSDTRLMNDFVEKDKLAIVSANPPSSNDKEQVPTVESDSINTETRDLSTEKPHDWLQNVLKEILEQNQVSKRSMDEILEDIRVALKPTDQLDSTASTETNSMSVKSQLEESKQSNERLQLEVESMQESKRLVENQIQNQKLINEDLITELTASKVQLNEVLQKLSSLELELEDRSHCCEELEAACLKLQHQLERYMHASWFQYLHQIMEYYCFLELND